MFIAVAKSFVISETSYLSGYGYQKSCDSQIHISANPLAKSEIHAVADPDTHLGGHIKRTGDLERSAEHWKQILALKGQLIYRFIHFPISSISYSTFFFLNVRPLFYFEILFLNFFLSSLSFNFHRGLNLSQELFSRMNCDV